MVLVTYPHVQEICRGSYTNSNLIINLSDSKHIQNIKGHSKNTLVLEAHCQRLKFIERMPTITRVEGCPHTTLRRKTTFIKFNKKEFEFNFYFARTLQFLEKALHFVL